MPVDDTQRLKAEPETSALPLARRPRSALARKPSSIARQVQRRAALVLRQPAPLLVLGFGAGLLARAALASLGRPRRLQTRSAQSDPESKAPEPIVAATTLVARVEAISIRAARVSRQG